MTKKEFYPLSFWSFNGDMQDDEIRLQIQQMKEQGYGGFFMHARAGMELEYMGTEWMHACRVAVEEAKKLDMKAWLYDENGWPSGFASGKVPGLGEEYIAKHLCFIRRKPKQGDGRILGAYKKCEQGGYRRIYEGDADLYCCLGQLEGYADLLNPKAMEAFIRFTHEKYYEEFGEYFGTVIPGIFTDEPQLIGKFPYTFSLPDLFQKKYGYDFFDHAWKLCEDDMEYASFKYDAAKLVAEILKNSFTGQIEMWCKKHHLKFTGHFSNEDGLCEQTKANYNLMAQYEVMSQPGIDFLGRRLTSPVLVKQISDAAYLHDKPMITSESFGCTGWDVSFNDLLWIAQWQAMFGINSIVTHLSAYSMKGRRKRDYPAFFSYQEPWWEAFHEVSKQIADINTFLSEGSRHIELLVVYPITSMWCTIAGQKKYSDTARYISNQFRLLVENLIDLQKDFLIVTEEELENFEIIDGKLCFNEISAPTVFLPDSLSWDDTTYYKLEEFSKKQGNVVFINKLPSLCEGRPNDKARYISAEVIDNRRGLLEKYFLATNQNTEIVAIDGFYGEAAEGIVLSTRYLENEQRVCIMNPSRNATRNLYLRVAGNKVVEHYKRIYDGKFSYLPFTLTPTECVSMVIKDAMCNEIQTEQELLVHTRQLPVEEVELMSDNALNIEFCDIYVNGKLFDKHVRPICCTDALYEYAYQCGETTNVRLVYRFTSRFAKDVPDNIKLVAESDNMHSICINGAEVLPQRDGWWIDKSFHTFPISEHVIEGENEVSMEFVIVKPGEQEAQGDFEGYRNRFFFPTEPESIYITGDFDVVTDGKIYEGIESLHVDGNFYLTDATKKIEGELTRQNLWFYRGNVKMKTSFVSEKNPTILQLKDVKGTAAEVFLNSKRVGIISKTPYRLDLTSEIVFGHNELEIVLYGSNRNLLGPHHHIAGNPHFVGPTSFVGEKGFPDFIYPQITDKNTYTDRYSFVKLFGGNLILEEKSI